jgi:hypothetical protein
MFDTNAPRRSFRPVRSDHPVYRSMEHQPAVEIKPENAIIRFTRRVRHDRSLNARISY